MEGHMRRFVRSLSVLVMLLAFLTTGIAAKPAPVLSHADRIVYVTKSGTKHHAGDCRYLSKSKIAIKLSGARASGYTACSVCGGG
jgi:hypothetical protein